MRYDIVSLGKKYRGMERSLTTSHLWNRNTKKIFEELLETYYLYIDIDFWDEINRSSFERICACYKKFLTHNIPCELIAYDILPIEDVYGYPIELLGIDIVHDMCESLISDNVNPKINHLLNENGLCRTVSDIDKIIPFQDHGTVAWSPCYVYKVKFDVDSDS